MAIGEKTKPNMLEGSVFWGLMRLMWPIMLMNVATALLAVIDMTVLGVMVDDNAVGSVGACGMLGTLFTTFFIGIATGSNVAVARHIGAKHTEEVKTSVGTSLIIALCSGALLLVFGIFCARLTLIWNNCPESLLDGATLYLQLYCIAAPFILLYNFGASLLRAMGDTKSPMLFLIVGGVLKIVLNIVLILLFQNGIAAVGISTILSNLVTSLLILRTLLKRPELSGFRLLRMRFSAAEAKKILYVGVPVGVQSALWSVANVVISAAVNTFGAAATKGISIANQFDNVIFQISVSPAAATVSYVAQNAGAGNAARVRRTVLDSVLITVAFGASFGALSALLSPQLSSLMTSDPAVIAYSRQKMLLISGTYFVCGINYVMSGTLQGLEKPFVPTVSAFLYMCVLRFVWVYAVFPPMRAAFPNGPHLTFLYLVWPIGWVLAIVTALFFYFPAANNVRLAVPAAAQSK